VAVVVADPVFRDPNTCGDSPWPTPGSPLGGGGFLFATWRQAALRKRLAALLAFGRGSAPGGLPCWPEDDDFFGQRLQQFWTNITCRTRFRCMTGAGKYLFFESKRFESCSEAVFAPGGAAGAGQRTVVLLVDLSSGRRLESAPACGPRGARSAPPPGDARVPWLAGRAGRRAIPAATGPRGRTPWQSCAGRWFAATTGV